MSPETVRDACYSGPERNSRRALGAVLRMTESQHSSMMSHLFPGDGREAIALALCGRAGTRPATMSASGSRTCLMVHEVVLVPYDSCERSPTQVTWKTDALAPMLQAASRRGMALLKIHSHPTNFARFSRTDDESDRELFGAVSNYVEGLLPHASAVMLPDGAMFARLIFANGAHEPIESVAVVGHDLRIWRAGDWTLDSCGNRLSSVGTSQHPTSSFNRRTRQAFGDGTVAILGQLSIAVLGASGTGSPTVEMLARLGVGELVIVDPDVVENKNRDRIIHATEQHVRDGTNKAIMLASAVEEMGLGTRVQAIPTSLWDPEAVARISQCDVVIGCMDSVDGRDLLNRLATYYSIPYIDIGVRLEADGQGGLNQISGSVHYIFPGGSSLFSRGVLTAEQIRAAVLWRTEPETYRSQKAAKYIEGIQEDRPAVISVNFLYASIAVNELLARLHGFREDPNSEYARTQVSLTQWRASMLADGVACDRLASKVGRGDLVPLLGTPELGIIRVSEA